jgi:transposase
MAEFRAGIIRLFEQGKSGYSIAKDMKLSYDTVKAVIRRFRETGSYDDRPRSGRPRTARTPANKRKIKGRIQRNPSSRKNSTRKMAKAIGVGQSSVMRIFFVEMGIKVNGDVYRDFLRTKVLPWARRTYRGQHWVWQEDGAPSHKAIATRDLVKNIFPEVIDVDISPQRDNGEWPPN